MKIESVNLPAFEGKTIEQIEKMVKESNLQITAKEIYKHLTNKGKSKKTKKSEEA